MTSHARSLPVPMSPTGSAATEVRPSLLRAFLQAYWLRPENAFWMTLRGGALDRCAGASPSIDVSCGDGVFSFLHAGGAFAPEFDVFTAVDSLDRVTHGHADMFDAEVKTYAPPIVRRPAFRISVGTDLKTSMLRKAATLEFYEQLIRHDGNERLPLSDGRFGRVYCNSAYWIANIAGFLGELRRITRADGRVILHVKLSDMRRYTLDGFAESLGAKFLDIIGRGRLKCWPSLASRSEWERRFAAAGFSMERCDAIATRTHAHLWDVGLRPLAPLLVRMANALTPRTRASIKRDWVALFEELLEPITRPDFDLFARADEPAELQYVLRP